MRRGAFGTCLLRQTAYSSSGIYSRNAAQLLRGRQQRILLLRGVRQIFFRQSLRKRDKQRRCRAAEKRRARLGRVETDDDKRLHARRRTHSRLLKVRQDGNADNACRTHSFISRRQTAHLHSGRLRALFALFNLRRAVHADGQIADKSAARTARCTQARAASASPLHLFRRRAQGALCLLSLRQIV